MSAQVTEGKATIYFPSEKGVFYNPPQIPNRDLSVLVLREFAQIWCTEAKEKATKAAARAANDSVKTPKASMGSHTAMGEAEAAPANAESTDEASAGTVDAAAAGPRLRVLDALSASGLRALRYTLEVPEVTQVVANDVDATAVAALRDNIARNNISEQQIVPNLDDAVALMHKSKPPHSSRFEVVDLDPYGTAAPFLDSAMQSVAEGGMLMVTCTDLAVLAGAYPEACFAKYGSWPLKARYCHEAALRIVLSSMEGHANRHRRYIVPLLSVHINFYVRLFVRVYTGPSEVKLAATKMSSVYQCSGCETYTMQPLARRSATKGGNFKVIPGAGPPVAKECEHCGRVHHVGGPLWSAPIHDTSFIERLQKSLSESGTEFESHKRLQGMLTLCAEELPDVPLFQQLSNMCNTLHVPNPPMVGFISALLSQGYKVSRTHTDPSGVKTDAPRDALWDVLRCWAKTITRSKPLSLTSPAHAILQKEPKVEADFTPLPAAIQLLQKKDAEGGKVVRFLENPKEWGPGSRGTAHAGLDRPDADSSSLTVVAAGVTADTVAAAADGAATDGAAAAAGADPRSAEALQASMLEKRSRNQNKRINKRSRADYGRPPTATPEMEEEIARKRAARAAKREALESAGKEAQ